MDYRKNIYSLDPSELKRFLDAVNALKQSGVYDEFIRRHHEAMMDASCMLSETFCTEDTRNVAHKGPVFLPWHRKYIRDFELALQSVQSVAPGVPDVTLPYWDWAADAGNHPNPALAPLWSATYIGGDGDSAKGDFVQDGPFKDWVALIMQDGVGGMALVPRPGLQRRLGRDPSGSPTLPTPADVADCLTSETDSLTKAGIYDSAPWNMSSSPSFRNRLEGWLGHPTDATLPPRLHNRVHTWVGGDMLFHTSPNDPVFFLNHCNVDRLWAQWQVANSSAPYVPAGDGPPGQNLTDAMQDLGVAGITPASTLDHHAMDYMYDTEPALACAIITDRSAFGNDEIDAMHPSVSAPAKIEAAFYVIVDGFSAEELGITKNTLNPPPDTPPDVTPDVTLMPPAGMQLTGMTVKATACKAVDSSLPVSPQRFTWTYQVRFTSLADFTQETLPVTLTAAITSTIGVTVTGQAVITLVKQPNPYELDGPVSWLSTDLQVFRLPANGALPSTPGVTLTAGPNDFIGRLLDAYNDPDAPRVPNHPFDGDLLANAETSEVTLKTVENDAPVYNFAVARVRYRALATLAPNVRVFFRLFPAASASTDFQPSTTYPTGGQDGTKIPVLGVVNGELHTIPCFAAPRAVDLATGSLDAQTDLKNVRQIGPDATGAEVQAYFGCWLDINTTTADAPRSVVPQSPVTLVDPMNKPHGPYTGPFESILTAFSRSPHQCLVAEINFDPEPLTAGVTPAASDKLAQRNLAVVGVASPHLVPQTFEVRPTAATVPPDQAPDELMIEWGKVPDGTTATIYLPGTSAETILAMANTRYATHRLMQVDAHTLGCPAQGITYMPIPPGVGSNFAGLLTLDLPATVEHGQTFIVLVRQITNASGQRFTPVPTSPPPMVGRLTDSAGPAGAADQQPLRGIVLGMTEEVELLAWRRVIGAFQVSIPVRRKEALRGPEEQLLAVLRWIQAAIVPQDRWFPVFQRYVAQVADRVRGLGGNPDSIAASPYGVTGGTPAQPAPSGSPVGAAAAGNSCALQLLLLLVVALVLFVVIALVWWLLH
jgi:hypothetical protein